MDIGLKKGSKRPSDIISLTKRSIQSEAKYGNVSDFLGELGGITEFNDNIDHHVIAIPHPDESHRYFPYTSIGRAISAFFGPEINSLWVWCQNYTSGDYELHLINNLSKILDYDFDAYKKHIAKIIIEHGYPHLLYGSLKVSVNEVPMKIFISSPMHNRNYDDVDTLRKIVKEVYTERYKGRKVEIIDQFSIPDPPDFDKTHPTETAKRLYRLGRSIQMMGDADLVVFADDWYRSKGCHVELSVCENYGLNVSMISSSELKAFMAVMYNGNDKSTIVTPSGAKVPTSVLKNLTPEDIETLRNCAKTCSFSTDNIDE